MTDTIYVGGPGHGLRSLPAGLTAAQRAGEWAYTFYGSFFDTPWPDRITAPAPGPMDVVVSVNDAEFARPDPLLCCGRGGSVPLGYTGYGGTPWPGSAQWDGARGTIVVDRPTYDRPSGTWVGASAGWIAFYDAFTACAAAPTALAQADCFRALLGSFP